MLIIFDEFAPVALMDRRERVNAERYPNFAAFARTSTWYRSATTVQWLSEIAVPAVMTGILPPPHKKLLPIYSDHPKSIFTLFNGSYRVTGVESLTNLCPGSICKNEKGSSTQEVTDTTGSLANDAGVVYLHLVLPHPYSDEIPAISDSWGNFGQAEHEALARKTTHGPLLPCARNVCRFAQTFKRGGKSRASYVLHSLLPHVPYLYLPSGRRYGIEVPILRGVQAGYWKQDWPRPPELPALPAPDGVHGPRARLHDAPPSGGRALGQGAGDRRRRPRRQLPARAAATPADAREPAGHRVRPAVRRSCRTSTAAGSTTASRAPSTSSRRSRSVLHVKIPWHVDGHPLVGRRPPADGQVSLLVGDGKYATGRLLRLARAAGAGAPGPARRLRDESGRPLPDRGPP